MPLSNGDIVISIIVRDFLVTYPPLFAIFEIAIDFAIVCDPINCAKSGCSESVRVLALCKTALQRTNLTEDEVASHADMRTWVLARPKQIIEEVHSRPGNSNFAGGKGLEFNLASQLQLDGKTRMSTENPREEKFYYKSASYEIHNSSQ
ncbi:uncharacterized protein RSE6_01855 [Rhynchosporium secalis]|uniref:Uncharacterized protein n=1 Tax=Rhynchosporium secalis TaxID=38038 RepID=A0A1E1LYT5_RHYSE|nr:uncharacterized protein RSE6_01855 [Rhynchosporium secalis]